MKIHMLMILLLMPVVALAQNYKGMSEEDMQKMMQQMQEMQACVENVDQAKLNALEQRARQMEADIKSMCAAGKRSEAQARALSFSKEISTDPTMKQLNECRAMMEDAMPQMPYMGQQNNPYMSGEKDPSKSHVCD